MAVIILAVTIGNSTLAVSSLPLHPLVVDGCIGQSNYSVATIRGDDTTRRFIDQDFPALLVLQDEPDLILVLVGLVSGESKNTVSFTMEGSTGHGVCQNLLRLDIADVSAILRLGGIIPFLKIRHNGVGVGGVANEGDGFGMPMEGNVKEVLR